MGRYWDATGTLLGRYWDSTVHVTILSLPPVRPPARPAARQATYFTG